jgi:hypothetical protein
VHTTPDFAMRKYAGLYHPLHLPDVGGVFRTNSDVPIPEQRQGVDMKTTFDRHYEQLLEDFCAKDEAGRYVISVEDDRKIKIWATRMAELSDRLEYNEGGYLRNLPAYNQWVRSNNVK